MIIINFTHPLTSEQKQQIEQMGGGEITAVHDISCQFDNEQPFAPQVAGVVDEVPLSGAEWQTEALLINPPAYAPATSILLAELHGRIGYFPSFIRIRPFPFVSN